MERIPSHLLLTKRAVALLQLLLLIFISSCNEPTVTRKINFIAIDSISPESGSVDGGTLLTIEGRELQYVTSVTVGGSECTNLTVSEDTLTCETPPHANGSATVRIFSSKDGAVNGSFTYVLPDLEVSSFTPTLSRATGGTRITIRGEGFSAGMIVTIGGVSCPSVTVVSSETLTCIIPALAPGLHSVVVEDPEGEIVTASVKFNAAAVPVMTAINPAIGTSNGGTVITITGTDFDRATVVIGGINCAITARSPTSITCVSGAKTAGVTYVRILNDSGISETYNNAYTYAQAPVPAGISPAFGVPAGGDTITINGSHFKNPALVTIGGVACTPVTFVSSSQLTCVTGVSPAGAYDVVVTNPDTFTGTVTNGFEYRELPPTLASIAPTFGVIGGGDTITLTGTGFLVGVSVTINGVVCASVNRISATSVECVTPVSLTEGAKDVVVTNTDGQSAVLTGAFTYQGPPTIASVSPPGGPTAGGNTITITGTNYRAGLAVNVGGQVCDSIAINSLTELTCVPRAHAVGATDIVITNTDLQSVTGTGVYLYADAPTVGSTSPDGGPAAGNATVRVIGTNFQSGATITFDGDPCAPVTFVSATELDCVTPAHVLGAVTVEVTNPDTQVGSLGNAYTYRLPPTLSSVSPAGGTTAGGTAIVLTGTDFMAGATVTIDSVACTVTAETPPTSITCTTPAHAAGAFDVSVTNPDGQTSTLTNGFTYLAPPTVASVSPNSGALAGNTTVTVTGTGFFNGATVDFGGSACATVLVTSSTTLTCITSAHAAGAVTVTVTNIDGQSGGAGSAYSYSPAPAITAISPGAGALAGNTTVTITGTDFVNGATVDFGGSPCAVTSTAATQIVCTTSSHAAGAVDVTVTNPDTQDDVSSGGYTYQPTPTITGVSPGGISTSGGNTLTLSGTGFVAGADVVIGGVACVVTALTSTSIDCTTGVHAAGVADIVVTNDDTQSATLTSGVTYLDPPTITGVSPTTGPLAGGGTLTVSGTNFFTGAVVEINGISCPVLTQSGTEITCTIPADVGGAHDVVVTNVDGEAVTLPGGYTHQPRPTVTSVAFNAGAVSGGTTVTVNGSDFLNGALVSFGGADCLVTAVTSTTISCITSPRAAGTVNVLVTNPDSQTGTLLGGYTYQAAPSVSSVSPVVGRSTGGTSVTITGTGFLASPSVSIGSVNCAVTSSSLTSITCTTTARAAGLVDVQVTNQDGQSGIKTNSFTYLDSPTIASISPSKGALAGNSTVTITGTNFTTGVTVDLDTSPCAVTAVTATTITCKTPAHAAGDVDVTVSLADTTPATLVNGFEYRPAPTVTSVSPTFGPVSGGTSITITGANFAPPTTVTVGTAACTTTAENTTSITCTTDFSVVSGGVNVRVTNPEDFQTGIKTTAFIFLMPPTVTSVSPTSGRATGGTTVTLSGTGFYPGATATVGGVVCGSPTVVNETTFTCVTGAHASGTVDVVFTNGDGQSVTRANGFTYRDAPTVASISPGSGPLAGGTTVSVGGTNFYDGATVKIGGSNCTSVVVVNSTSITCTTPPGLNGFADVQVTNADGQSDTFSNLYQYRAGPTLTSVSPSGGPLAGGTTITLLGANFLGSTVTIGGTACGTVSIVDSGTITCVTPAKASGSYTVSVTNVDNQVASKVNGFRYQGAPTVTNISPAVGASSGNTLVTISGTNFLSGTSVSIGGTPCTTVTVATATSLTCRTGVHAAGTGAITVTNSDGQSGTGSSYLYQDAPAITSVSPATSGTAGGQAITITGTGFLAGATVKIGGTSCTSVTVVSLTEITCITGAKTAGTYDLVVMNTDTQTGTLSGGFVYQSAPSITNVSPTRGDVNGGQALTITGTSFITGALVSIGGTSCPVSAVTATSITCTTAAKVSGLYDVVVTNPDSQTGTRASAYSYVNAPTVTSVSPATGSTLGGTTITITGTNFFSGSSVDLGGSACTSVNVTSTTSLNCVTPAGAAGAVTVSVVSPFSTTGTLAGGYTYAAAAPELEFVTGTSSPTPPNPDNYGSTTTNITHTFTIRNKGGSDTTAVTVSIGGANPAAFVIGTDNCTGAPLASGATCTVQVSFTGSVLPSGTYNGTVTATAATGGTVSNVITGQRP